MLVVTMAVVVVMVMVKAVVLVVVLFGNGNGYGDRTEWAGTHVGGSWWGFWSYGRLWPVDGWQGIGWSRRWVSSTSDLPRDGPVRALPETSTTCPDSVCASTGAVSTVGSQLRRSAFTDRTMVDGFGP